MAKQQKAKNNKGERNDARKSGRAAKQNPGRKVTGSKHVHLTETEKILLGGGLYSKWRAVVDGKTKGL